MAYAFVGLGSNLGHPRRQLARAVRALARLPRTHLIRVSRSFVTAPLDAPGPQPDYVNSVALLSTALAPRALLARMHAIERRQRRRRDALTPRNAPRTIDLDLLLFARRRMAAPKLTLPHPRMHQRAFVLRPLASLAPSVTIPARGLARRHLRAVRDQAIRPIRAQRLDPPSWT